MIVEVQTNGAVEAMNRAARRKRTAELGSDLLDSMNETEHLRDLLVGIASCWRRPE